MGGFITVNTKISGVVGAPGLPFSDSPTGGLYETSAGGFGFSLSGENYSELSRTGYSLGCAIPTGISLVNDINYGLTLPIGMSITTNGLFLFVMNAVGLDFVLNSYRRDLRTGRLTPSIASPIMLGGIFGYTLSPNNRQLVIVTDNGSYGSFIVKLYNIDQTDGSLIFVSDSTVTNEIPAAPIECTFSPDGSLFYILTDVYYNVFFVTDFDVTNQNLGFGTGVNFSFGNFISPDGLFIYGNYPNSIVKWTIDQNNFAITSVTYTPASQETVVIGISPNGNYLFTVEFSAYPSSFIGRLCTYTRNISNGSLSLTSRTPLFDNLSTQTKLSIDGSLIIIPSQSTEETFIFSVNNGIVTLINNAPFSGGIVVPQPISISPDNNYLYMCDVDNDAIADFMLFTTYPTYPLIQATFSPTGQSDGIFNIMGELRILGNVVLTKDIADNIYAKISGDIQNGFNARELILDNVNGGIVGAPDSQNCPAGFVGEYIEATLDSSSGIALTTNTPADVVSITLTPGDWDVSGMVGYVFDATTLVTHLSEGVSTTSATMQEFFQTAVTSPAYAPGNSLEWCANTPVRRVSLDSTITVYLVTHVNFTVSTCNAYGLLRARRMR
jgi:6-phosphogluconolactonase (cycloisomerase 2 family)